MNLKEQLYICTLAETGSLTQAAKQLYISQPALSLHISNLENTLGIRLFDRIGKQFVPTQSGELYIEKAKKMLEMKEEFETQLLEIKNGQNERLRIGIQDIRSHFIMPAVVPILTDLYPKTKTVWTPSNYQPLEQMLLSNQLDICFCNCTTRRKEFEYIPLLKDEFVFIAPKDHPLTMHKQVLSTDKLPWIDLALFQNERFILVEDTQSLRKLSNQVLKSCCITPKNTFVIRKIFIMMALINQGYGVGFSMLGYIDWSNHCKNLAIFSVTDKPLTTTFYAFYKKGRTLSEAAKTLIELSKTALTSQIPLPLKFPTGEEHTMKKVL